MRKIFFAAALFAILVLSCAAQSPHAIDPSVPAPRALIERFSADQYTLSTVYQNPHNPAALDRTEAFLKANRAALKAVDFGALDRESEIDVLLFANLLTQQEHQLALDRAQWREVAPLVPYADALFAFENERRQMQRPDPQQAAKRLTDLVAALDANRATLEAKAKASTPQLKIDAWRAAAELEHMQAQLDRWASFWTGYDPAFTWWTAQPLKQASDKLKDQEKFLRETVAGVAADDKTTVVGMPVGREALLHQLDDAMIPYTPEELIAMAQKQLDWCHAEMKKASREMGYGDDWQKAIEHVKNTYVDPGKQPELIRALALEGEQFARDHDLVTIPALADETWRMEMMTPERQLANPFFLGGDTIIVSYPTDSMTYEQRMMSMRGNNPGFSHATVFHELIPGHWLQQFMEQRYRPYRQAFDSGFWHEGNSLYWELLYWEMGFDKTPEQRLGALFWRAHRCARIVFSLSFHLGKMTPAEAIDLLVDQVGHERANATAEVRRSFNGDYDPLYQAAYMLGALQFRALRHEVVDSGKMSQKQYHDAILEEGSMPIPMLRALLTNEKLTPDWKPQWRFLEEAIPTLK